MRFTAVLDATPGWRFLSRAHIELMAPSAIIVCVCVCEIGGEAQSGCVRWGLRGDEGGNGSGFKVSDEAFDE